MRFAVKVFNISAHAPSGLEEEEAIYARRCYHRELEFLRSLSHPHLIGFEDSTVRDGIPYVIIEKMSCTLLEVQMDRTTQAPFGQLSPIELNSRIVSSHLLDGLSYLHSQHIVSPWASACRVTHAPPSSPLADPQRHQARERAHQPLGERHRRQVRRFRLGSEALEARWQRHLPWGERPHSLRGLALVRVKSALSSSLVSIGTEHLRPLAAGPSTATPPTSGP
jgi:hypothetical protein